MSRPLSLLLVAVLPAVSCVSVRHTGSATTATAHVGVEEGRLLVRPNEIAWALGDRSPFEASVEGEELGAFQSGGVVMVEGDAAGSTQLPDYVELAATRHLIAQQADGYIVTHYLVDAVSTGSDTRYDVKVWGRLLHLQDLGAMSQERADLRRLIDNLEAQQDGGTTRGRVPGLSALGGPPRGATRPPLTPGPAKVGVGVELGTVSGLVLDFPSKSKAIDATSLRIGGQISLLYGEVQLGVPTLAYQVEFVEGSPVQPIVGAAFSVLATYSGYPTIQGVFGVEIDPEMPLEATLGLRAGADAISGAPVLGPDLSIGWVW